MSKATNQKKGIVTRGSGHIAESSGVSLPYFQKGMSGCVVMDDNHIETSKCSMAMAAQRTLIEGHRVLHHKSCIGFPYGDGGTQGAHSTYDRPHGNAKNNPPAFGWFAYPDEKSPDTMVEGKWVVRTFDKTWQDAKNGHGKLSPGKGRAEILDESELLFQQCAVDKIKLACSHKRETTDGELHVYLGDTVTVTAYRVNASETDPEKRLDVHCHIDLLRKKKNTPAAESRHAAFVLTRNGRFVYPNLHWTEIKNKIEVGTAKKFPVEGSKKLADVTTLVLGKEWLLDNDPPKDDETTDWQTVEEGKHSVGPVGGTYGNYDVRQDAAAIRHDHQADATQNHLEGKVAGASTRLASAKAAPGRRGRASGAVGATKAQVRGAKNNLNQYEAQQEQRNKAKEAGKGVQAKTRLLLDAFKIVMEVFAFQPLRIDIEAHGCSPGTSARILAYPPEEFGAELAALKDWKNTFTQIKEVVSTIATFFKNIEGAGIREFGPVPSPGIHFAINVDLFFFRSKKSTGTGKTEKVEDCEPSIELALAWKELTRDSNPGDGEEKGRRAFEIRKKWEVELKLERLLGLYLQIEVDFSHCLGVAAVIADILTFFGVKTGIFLNINFNLSAGIGGKIGVDEYGKWTVEALLPGFKAVSELSIIGKIGKFAEIGLHLQGRWEPRIVLCRNNQGQVCGRVSESTLELIFNFEAKADILGWDLDYTYVFYRWTKKLVGADLAVFGGAT